MPLGEGGVSQHALVRWGVFQHALGKGVVCLVGCLPRDVCQGGVFLGECLPGGVCQTPPPVYRMTDRHLWKYYFAATSLWTVKIWYSTHKLWGMFLKDWYWYEFEVWGRMTKLSLFLNWKECKNEILLILTNVPVLLELIFQHSTYF